MSNPKFSDGNNYIFINQKSKTIFVSENHLWVSLDEACQVYPEVEGDFYAPVLVCTYTFTECKEHFRKGMV